MTDMRLIVAGAGGRMGRTLIKAIAETERARARGRDRGRELAADRARIPACSRGSAPIASRS